ncbi:2,3-bisphosphoglycerate-independent phosphoglycerate mutase [Sinobacterium norvegicum]|uniref:2,3-bisphosphoglycerate-independent phosphoglycerate mutase n=1 Tax=Sinobacterium norvegicum TaxID=1641715 RepID=A0ABM9AIK1_9GAMM|nr:2,3-bisphosphoglycerate-independent phosphoglycerate mutase [Sinobacterium norvegicum]CAH0992889.1 2,3-bisphosphoglycerate-independent phosphoglycerate mutase [Sinobacterium norvegicum]
MTNSKKTPIALIILDGWGHREATDYNAIAHGNTPHWDKLIAERPHTLISASGEDVGLPEGQMGNSEVGHMSLGAGRIVYQNISKVDQAIKTGEFETNAVLVKSIDDAVAANKAVHLMGLLSPGGVHSHQRHIIAAIELAAKRGAKAVYLHAFLDGRDTPPRSAETSIAAIDDVFSTLGCGRIASIIGRYYAMDRDNRWDRVSQAYELLTEAKSEYSFASATEGLNAAYQRDENDEFVAATVIQTAGQPTATINDGDSVLFMNFRADRAREITRAFVDTDFDGFARNTVPAASFTTLTEYAASIKAPCAFPPVSLDNVLGDYLAKQGKTQLRIAETEKYAHVTFFFSGGQEELFEGEQRILINSPDVATYDLQPEMSAPEVTEKLVGAIEGGEFDVIICNYANGDMVGHTGVFEAAVKAAEAIDQSVKAVTDAIERVGGQCLITADHGNCEQMLDTVSGQKHTQHTTEHVPLVYVGPQDISLNSNGRLCDMAPTLLSLINVEQPSEMTGVSLAVKQ